MPNTLKIDTYEGHMLDTVTEKRKEDMLTISEIAIKVGKAIGKGRDEKIYQGAFCQELSSLFILNQKEETLPILYEGINIGFERADIHIYHPFTPMILEMKAIEQNIAPKHHWQVISYMRSTKCDIGAVINYNQCASKTIQTDFIVLQNNIPYLYDFETGLTKGEPMNDY